jgi:hypothetical protein
MMVERTTNVVIPAMRKVVMGGSVLVRIVDALEQVPRRMVSPRRTASGDDPRLMTRRHMWGTVRSPDTAELIVSKASSRAIP